MSCCKNQKYFHQWWLTNSVNPEVRVRDLPPRAPMSKERHLQLRRVPTVNDIRVKKCWICLEEETYQPGMPVRPDDWCHPCSCSLICHTKVNS